MRKLMSLFIWCWLVTAAHAQVVAPPSIELRDEGSVLGRVRVLDCTGTGISCTRNGSVGTIDGSGGASGAPVDAQYWVSAANGSLSAEVNLGAFGTGLVLNTAGTPSIYAGTTCTNQVIRLLSASGVATCTTVTATDVDTTIWTGTAISGILKAASQGVVAAATAGVDYAAASHSHVDADLTSSYSGIGDCGAGNFARVLNDNGAPTCAADDDTPDSLSELPTIATARIVGRVTAATGAMEELTGTQATTLLDTFTDALKGVAPASGGGTTNFLRADGSWAAPPGGSGAPTDATYWTGAAHASLSAEINLGALGTGLVINTTGTPSIYAGTSCTNQFPRALSASGAATCADVTAADFGSQTANLVLAAPDGAPGDPTFRALVDADIPNTITLTNLTQIGTRAISDTTGTLLVPRGGSGLTTVAANQLYVGTAADTFTAKTLPSCSNGTNDKLLYNNSTNEFSCGTDQGGAGGGLSHDQTMTRIAYGF